MYKLIANCLTICLLISIAGISNADHRSKKTIDQRTLPTAKVYRDGDDVPKSIVIIPVGPRDGKTIYNSKCMACHATGVAGAPKFAEPSAWSERLKQGEATLISNAINGLQKVGVMPAKGGCADCSDDEIKQAVLYMLSNSQ